MPRMRPIAASSRLAPFGPCPGRTECRHHNDLGSAAGKTGKSQDPVHGWLLSLLSGIGGRSRKLVPLSGKNRGPRPMSCSLNRPRAGADKCQLLSGQLTRHCEPGLVPARWQPLAQPPSTTRSSPQVSTRMPWAWCCSFFGAPPTHRSSVRRLLSGACRGSRQGL